MYSKSTTFFERYQYPEHKEAGACKNIQKVVGESLKGGGRILSKINSLFLLHIVPKGGEVAPSVRLGKDASNT